MPSRSHPLMLKREKISAVHWKIRFCVFSRPCGTKIHRDECVGVFQIKNSLDWKKNHVNFGFSRCVWESGKILCRVFDILITLSVVLSFMKFI